MTVDAQVTRDVVEVITGGWRAQALYTAVKLDLPDLIQAGRTTCAQMAESTGAEEEGIRRLMRLLVAMGVFERDGSDGYRNTAVSAALIDGPQSLREMCLLHGEEYYNAWRHSHHAISTTSSGFEIAYGQPFYAYLSQDAPTAERFQHAMNAGNMFFPQVPATIDFSGGKTVVDVGGGGGDLLASILGATPDARGTLFEQEHMLAGARAHLADTVGPDRVRFVGGDMFDEVPAGGDFYILCRVLAGWDDDAVVEVFANCRRAMPRPTSRLVVIDRLVTDENCTVLPAMWDLQLLMINGGRHRTLDRFATLLTRAGLTIERVADLPMENTALIATPTPPT